MSGIFISHSSKDNRKAAELCTLLEQQGHRSIFLDFDPEQGIPPGRDWEQELYAQLRSCKAVIVLCTQYSMSSNWCFAEITHAKALGKQIFPLKLGDCTINTILTSRQVLDLSNPSDGAYRQLCQGLVKAGLDPSNAFEWDGKRPPYPGLMSLHEADAGVFFGREPEIQSGLDLLNRLRQFGGARLVTVLGASGCGKSSLVLAGIIPRLRRDPDRWLILAPFRPGADPLLELASCLSQALRPSGHSIPSGDIHERFLRQPNPGSLLVQAANEIRRLAGQREATVLLVLDQIEELLTYEDGRGAQQLLPLLDSALNAPGSPLMVLATLRSDFLGQLQLHPAARSLRFETLPLGPMPRERLARVIEGPAEMACLRLEPGLTNAILRDTENDGALPLLAFTLRELYEKHGGDGLLTIEEYRDKLGGLSGSIADAAEAVYHAKPLSPELDADLRRAFRLLVRVNEEGQYVRQAVSWKQFPPRIHDVLARFVQARLLVSRGQGEDRMLEAAHEALFRSWQRLKSWLDEDREFLLWQQRLQESVRAWERASQDRGALLRGGILVEAERHLQLHGENLSDSQRSFITQSLEQQQVEEREREQARAERERMQRRNNQRLRLFLAGALVLTAVAGWEWNTARLARDSAEQDRKTAQNEREKAEQAQEKTINEMIAASWKTGTFLGPRVDTTCPGSYIQGVRCLAFKLRAMMNLERLQSLAPMPIFLPGGPHKKEFNFQSYQFGHYNPDFVRWATEHLIPASKDAALRKLTQTFYNQYLLDVARCAFLTHSSMKKDPKRLNAAIAEYQKEIRQYEGKPWKEFSGPHGAVETPYRPLADEVLGRHYSWDNGGLNWYFAITASEFWVRRTMDGTADDFDALLRKLLETYDAQWLKHPS